MVAMLVVIVPVSIAGTVALLSGESQLARTGLLGSSAWVSPLVAMTVLGGAMLVLLVQPRSTRRGGDTTDVVPCASCGRDLLGEWRMCPYCGERVARKTAGSPGGSAPGV